MRQGERRLDCPAKRIFVRAVRRGPGSPTIRGRANRNRQTLLGDVLVYAVVGKAGERIRSLVNVNLGFACSRQLRKAENIFNDAAKVAHRVKRLRGAGGAHDFAKAEPIFTLQKRAGAAPCPVPMVCIGWPLPQLGVPQSVQWSREQMASHEFQNSVVMPL